MTALELDRTIRQRVYTGLAADGRAPSGAMLAGSTGVDAGDVRAALARLHDAHALVLDGATGEVRMALPFSSVETAYRVEAGGRGWWANCAWDSLAIPRVLGLREARIVDRGSRGREGRELAVVDGRLVERDGAISIPVPAWRWWDDIVFT